MRKILVLAAVAAATLLNQPAFAEIGRIKSTVGDVTIIRGAVRFPAKAGFALEPGDVVRTLKDGQVGIAFQDNTRFAIGPKSEVEMTKFVYDRSRQTGESLTYVRRGSLGVVSGNIAKSSRDAMRVRTPKSMLGVRGTKFVVEVK